MRVHAQIAGTLAVVLALTGTAEAAARRADLTVSNVAKPPATAHPGGSLSVSAIVRNTGYARARGTTILALLSRDARPSKGDIRLVGAPKVAALKPGRHAAGSGRVKVPASAKVGTYRLLACADGTRKVRESSERDNCRAAKRTVRVSRAAGPAPGSPSTPTPTPTPTPTRTAGAFPQMPHPLSVGAETLDTAAAATNHMFSGGTLIAFGSDGTKYTLTVPFGALPSPADVTLTPVTAIAGLPFSKGLIGAVHLEPHGLQLLKPGTLTIEPATSAPIAEQTGFGFQEGGHDLHLEPLTSASKLTLPVTHFSTPGAARGTSADIANVEAHAPARTQAQLEQALAEIMRAQRERALGQPVAPGSTDGAVDVFTDYYDHVVLPKLNAAEVDDSLAADAVAAALGWARTAEVLGASDPKIANRETDMWQSIEAILVNAVDKGYQRCKDHDLTQITRLLSFERTAQILGFSLSGFTKALACAHFEVTFDAEVTSGTPSPVAIGGGGTDTFQGDWQRALTRVPVDISGSATASMPSTKFTFTRHDQTPCGSGGGSYTVDESAGTAPDIQAGINLFLDLNYREDPPAAEPAAAPRKSFLLVDPKDITQEESYNRTSTACGGAVTNTTFTNFDWYTLLEGFHSNAGMIRVDLDTSTQLNDLLASTHIVNTKTNSGITDHESTFVEVWHTPQ